MCANVLEYVSVAPNQSSAPEVPQSFIDPDPLPSNVSFMTFVPLTTADPVSTVTLPELPAEELPEVIEIDPVVPEPDPVDSEMPPVPPWSAVALLASVDPIFTVSTAPVEVAIFTVDATAVVPTGPIFTVLAFVVPIDMVPPVPVCMPTVELEPRPAMFTFPVLAAEEVTWRKLSLAPPVPWTSKTSEL